MYEEFYGFTATPFDRGMPGNKLFMPKEYQEVLVRMEYVSRRHLFAVLTGECGTGKSTVLRRLSDELDPHHYKMLYVVSAQQSLSKNHEQLWIPAERGYAASNSMK